MKVLISGSSGLIGSALRGDLENRGNTTVLLPRSFPDPIDFKGVDAVVHLAGENIAQGRWTTGKKRSIEQSRIEGTAQLANRIAEANDKPGVFICASAIGYYGDRGDERLVESSQAGSGFLPDVCKRWESAAKPAQSAGVRTIWLRTGIVLSRDGGALNKMLLPFKLGGGGVVGSGRQYMSWISLEDEISIIRYLIERDDLTGPFNLVSPNPVTNKEFTKTLGSVLHRPAILPMPAFAARTIFGEMADALLLSSTRVYPERIEKAGYRFRHPVLEPALRSILHEQ